MPSDGAGPWLDQHTKLEGAVELGDFSYQPFDVSINIGHFHCRTKGRLIEAVSIHLLCEN